MKGAKYISGAPPPSPSSSKPLAHAVPEPASAIRFALQFGCPQILQVAFYQLARTDVTKDWDDPTSYAAHADLPARWTLLSAPALMRLRGAKRMSERGQISVTTDEAFSAILQPECLPWWEDTACPADARWEVEKRDPAAYPCYSILMYFLGAAFREASPRVKDPLRALKDCVDYEKAFPAISTAPAKPLCVACDERFKEWIHGARQELWRKLPEYFEVQLTVSSSE